MKNGLHEQEGEAARLRSEVLGTRRHKARGEGVGKVVDEGDTSVTTLAHPTMMECKVPSG